ncbi:MAG: adenylyl cyclase, partial [Kiritimatiellae bacterium]|nr:adenylyl cyclase [Kiritimatiellia bacterium]
MKAFRSISLFVLALAPLCLAAEGVRQAALAAEARELFGEGVRLFSPEDDPAEVHARVEEVFRRQHHDQFGPARHALLFLPGDYVKAGTLNVGYYTQLLGLGRSPRDVKLCNVKTPAALDKNNATCNFWVGVENVEIVDVDGNDDPYFGFQWAVSQAAPARRLWVGRKAVFDWFCGWASGGFVADCVFRKGAGSWSQQQYYYRNCLLADGTYGVNWNKVIQACAGEVEKGSKAWRDGGSATILPAEGRMREKPFLFVEGGAFKVFVPALRPDAAGVSWGEGRPNGGMGAGEALDLAARFHVARADRDSAATL